LQLIIPFVEEEQLKRLPLHRINILDTPEELEKSNNAILYNKVGKRKARKKPAAKKSAPKKNRWNPTGIEKKYNINFVAGLCAASRNRAKSSRSRSRSASRSSSPAKRPYGKGPTKSAASPKKYYASSQMY
jgi:hypothetical protein